MKRFNMWVCELQQKNMFGQRTEKMIESHPNTIQGRCRLQPWQWWQIDVLGLHIFLKYSTAARFWTRFSTTCNCIDCIGVEKETQYIFHKLLNYWEETRSCQSIITLLEPRGQIFKITSSIWTNACMIDEKAQLFHFVFCKISH